MFDCLAYVLKNIYDTRSSLFQTICLQIRWLGERCGAPGVRFNAFRMHQFKCFTSNINSLSNPVFVSTGTNGLPNGLPLN